MRGLDQKDKKILSILADNARKSYSKIGEEVDLSGPAVSDRIDRLQKEKIINKFTINVNKSKIRDDTAVLIDLVVPIDLLDSVRTQLEANETVEHIFVTAEGNIHFYARVGNHSVHEWIVNMLGDDNIKDYTVTLVEDVMWTPTVDGMEFAIDCVECGKSIYNKGETARIGGDIYNFCCPSCLTRFEDRYDRLEENS